MTSKLLLLRLTCSTLFEIDSNTVIQATSKDTHSNSKLTLMHGFAMASAIKIIYLVQTINILYKMSFHSLSVSTLTYITQENVLF